MNASSLALQSVDSALRKEDSEKMDSMNLDSFDLAEHDQRGVVEI